MGGACTCLHTVFCFCFFIEIFSLGNETKLRPKTTQMRGGEELTSCLSCNLDHESLCVCQIYHAGRSYSVPDY